jgi:thiol-disulfide isomerase/thioredoxin
VVADEVSQASKAEPDAPSRARHVEALDRIIAALRAEEEKYRDIEYALRLTTRKIDPQDPDGAGDIESLKTRRVILQDDRIWFRGLSKSEAFDTDIRQSEFSAYDGERTRSVIAGNCVNIHLGRFEHPDVYPAHTVPLIHYQLNFPLSVYLSGTDTIHAHPKYGRFMRESGSVNEFTRVEAHVEGAEQVDGLDCVKIRVKRWYYSKDAPAVQYLWLARNRNHLSIKEQWTPSWLAVGGLPRHEMRALNLREIAPGVWFPMRITVTDYDTEALQQKKHVVARRTETVVEKVSLQPNYDPSFFRDVELPADLPIFTIRDRKLVGSSLPEPIADEVEEKAKLAEVVAKVKEHESRYADLEVKAGFDYKHVGSSMHRSGVISEQTNAGRSVVRRNLAHFTEHAAYSTVDGRRSEQKSVEAFDGQWTRAVNRFTRDDREEQIWASLRKGGGEKAEGRHDGVPIFRPHTFLLRDDWLYGPLADLLVSQWHDKTNEYRLRFRYCGEEAYDGHPCIKLRGDVTTQEGEPPHSFMAVWLAIDRNYIPIKLEHYGGNFGLQPMPGAIYRCDDFREIAPGIWYPYRATLFSFDNWQDMARGRITLTWHRDYKVESVTLSPKADAELFKNVVVPAGTKVQVSDEDGDYVGQYIQLVEGPAEITPAGYLLLLSEAKVRKEQQEARERAVQALIGKPAPEFPAGATWHNGKPLTWASLRGKVVILSFWAEWCGPCRNEFPQLSALHDARERNGLVIIGVHPPGSEQEAITKVTDEFKLAYPTCIDIPPKDGVKAWGDLFGRFAVHALTHAVAVDGEGTIIACGELGDVVRKANESVKESD